MYYIKDHHEGIVSREIYDAVQVEIARRNALKSPSKSMRPPAKVHMPANMRCRSAWSAENASHCTGAVHGSAPAGNASSGAVSAVWITGKVLPQLAYVGRGPLQQAILAALSSAMSDKDHLVHQITNAMQLELIQDSQSRTSLGMIERRLTELENQFQHLAGTGRR